jgi:TetR/AcrR family tetracycline transcriptional repressor
MNASRPSSPVPTRRRGAPPVGQRLSRSAVIAGARDLIEQHGLSGFSVRTLATALGVRPAALYNHVRDRDDLLDAVADQFVATLELPAPDVAWPVWVRAAARRVRGHMLAHPHLTEVVLARPAAGPASPALLAQFMACLEDAGVDAPVAHVAWHTVLDVVVGAVLREHARERDDTTLFDATVDLVIEGIRTLADRPSDRRAIALLRAHHLVDDTADPNRAGR